MNNRLRSPILSCILILFWLVFGNVAGAQNGDSAQRNLIDSFISEATASNYSASVLVVVDGNVLLKKGYGWIDSAQTVPANENTLYNIASITKSFTATAVFMLIEQGKLTLQDSLPQFFSHVPSDKRSITIEQLMLHTSGFSQNYVADGISQRDSAVSLILNDGLRYAPGEEFSYSNENYALLGAIIEIVSGKTYEQFIREHIFMKAGMTATKFWDEGNRVSNNTIATKNRELDTSVVKRNWGYLASGGLFTSSSELYQWFTSLINGSLLSPKSLRAMWEPVKELRTTSVTRGWYVSTTELGWTEIWTRGTEDWGHNGVLRWFPEQKTLIIVLTNSGEIGGDQTATGNRLLSDWIVRILFEQ